MRGRYFIYIIYSTFSASIIGLALGVLVPQAFFPSSKKPEGQIQELECLVFTKAEFLLDVPSP